MLKCECFKAREHPRPNITPKAIDMENDSKNIPVPCSREPTWGSEPWNLERVSYMTIDTASLRILSPKITEYKCGSTLY